MEKDESITPTSEDVVTPIDTDKLPDSISDMIIKILDLEKEVINSDESAKEAMKCVNDMGRYEEKGKIFLHRSGNTKDIIEDTQKAVEKLADALQGGVSALKKSFDFQKQLAEVSKYLFERGCTNIAMNKTVVLAIEAKLNGASKEQISNIARQELMKVVHQLKQQEDILKKQEFLTSKVKEIASRLADTDILDKQQSETIQQNANDIKQIFELIEHDKSKMICGHILRDLLNAVGIIAIGIALMQFPNKMHSIIAICAASFSLLSFVIDFIQIRIKKSKADKTQHDKSLHV